MKYPTRKGWDTAQAVGARTANDIQRSPAQPACTIPHPTTQGVAASMLTAQSQFEVTNLYARYCHAVDGRDSHALAACFTPDAELRGERLEPAGFVPTSRTVGRENIVAMFLERSAGRTGYVHDTFNVLVEHHGTTELSGRAYFRILTPDAEIECMGHYQDVLCLDDGHWRFKYRCIRFTWGTLGRHGERAISMEE
ncbi:nuclear transport factor 2 family protein [Nocardia sp. CA-290969]|uniref:nuclear transport factor 2 family protein n=1 Tax=Nocardia sp. CA-290969 TaxID=3239986 RepID=UPI003D8FB91F